MSNLLAVLGQASASLLAHRGAAATASHNLANASTPGYARQRAEIDAALPADMLGGTVLGRGAILAGVSQARDRFLEAQLPRAIAGSAFSAAEADALEGVSVLDPQAEGGLADALADFYAAIGAASQSPGDAGLRRAAVAASSAVARAFQRTASGIEAARTGLDERIAGRVEEIDAQARTLAELNREIRVARASGGEPNDLLDARQKAVDSLAELTGGTPVPDSGDVNVMLPGGGALVVGDGAARLSTLADPATGHLSVRLTPAGGGTAVALAGGALGGSLGGDLAARDGALAAAAAALDQLAFDWAGVVNGVHRAGFAQDGTTGLDLFSVGSTAGGAASRIAVDAGVAADPSKLAAAGGGGSGDGSNLLALLDTERASVSGASSVSDAFASMITSYGTEATRARAEAEQGGAVLDHLASLRASASGVSIDEEMIELTKAQRAYEAVMKVIATTDNMLEDLLNLR